MLQQIWKFIRDRQNREIVAWIGGGALVILPGLWAIFTYYFPHEDKKPATTAITVTQQGTGIASGGDTVINAPVNIGLDEKKVGEIVAAELRKQIAALRQGPPEAAAFAEPAEAALNAGEYDQAAALVAIAESQTHAVDLIAENHPEKALDVLREAERRLSGASTKTSATDYLLRGYVYKTYAQAYSVLGDEAQADQYLDQALQAFQKVKDDPQISGKTTDEFAGAINGIGNIHDARHQYKEAIAAYQLATSLVPDYAYAWHDMFLAYAALARRGEIDLPAMRNALLKIKETGPGRYPGFNAQYITQLETILAGFDQASHP